MKTQNPWMGRVRGSAGNMTGCKVYDKNVLRAKAFEVANPNTPAQQNQRAFFKEVAGVVATVSDDELRSLFGIKPKSMSRRNALSKQIAKAFSVVNGQKVVDFSKLQAIGNGQKCYTYIAVIKNGVFVEDFTFNASQLGVNVTEQTSMVFVVFDEDSKSIKLLLNPPGVTDVNVSAGTPATNFPTSNGYFYITCEVDGKNVFNRSFGSFIIKTRAEEKGRGEVTPSPDLSIYSNGRNQGSYFHFTDAHFDNSADKVPTQLKSGDTVVCSAITWDAENNWWGGTLAVALSEDQPITLVGDDDGTTIGPLLVDWVVQ